MADAQKSAPQMPAPPPFTPATPGDEGFRWMPILAGVVLVAVVIGLLIWFSRGAQPPAAPNPYTDNLKFSDIKLSAAQNFVGGTVTYIEGKVTNAGDKTVVGATVEAIFRNSLGQVVQREVLPVRVLVWQGPDRDVLDLRTAPLKPGATADFRLSIEGTISTDWNQGYPEMRVASVSTQ
jgi:hypothetical protein